MARFFAGLLGERWGRQVVVDNRPGAEGMIGSEMVVRAPPDGYTLLMASTAVTMNPAVLLKMPYDTLRDFDFAAIFGRAPVMIIVGPSLPVGSVKELVALARAKPNYITMASAGGFMHFVSAMFRSHGGFDAAIALYKGGGPALTDVMGGHAHMAVATVPTAAPHLRTGKVKALATGGAKRMAAYPDLPTVMESGIPTYEASIWWGWAGPGGMPRAILTRLNNDINAIVRQPDTGKRFAADGAEPEFHALDELKGMIKVDLAKWAKVADDAKMPRQ
jgi:tripartite-type tricarboxylate transporter receptor subunit TctC